ncbi:MAG TPA: SpoIIE family protein phosphatase [Solirubrobacteraceae bacterium]|nr:SpoIIE family protein phosphatase [Solirubrobacteraceae bacterium]
MDSARALAALDELPEATVVLQPVRDDAGAVVDFVFDYANRLACSLVGGPAPSPLLGRRLLEMVPDFSPKLLARFAAVVDSGEPLRARVDQSRAFAERADFSGRFDVSASRLGDALLVVYADEDLRARARATERRYGAVLEATSDWVSIADGDNNLLYVNPAGRRMVGIGLDEDITGRRIGEFSPAWARERVLNEALEVARREGVWRGDLARLHRDGHEIPISQVIVARTTPGGEVDFYATIARDMTRERAAEAALRESEERFRIAFEQAPIGVSLLDLAGNFVQVNDAYCETVRRSRAELLRLGPAAITHPDDVAFTRYAMRLVAAGKVPVFRFEKRYLDAAGDSIWVEISGSLFRDAEGRPQYLIGMVQDLGERRVAHTLQRSMLPSTLPHVEGVELAYRYLPGTRQTQVGGDWYDVVPLPDGRVGVVIGDVVGRGIEAAATMSQLRNALRAYAIEGLEPAGVVGKLHRLVNQLRVGMSTTLVYMDFEPFTRELRYVSAGHMPVLHLAAGGAARFLAGARSTPLGTATAGAEIPQERLVLAPGDGVLLYTDGLVERRDERIDSRLEQLRSALAEAPGELGAALDHLTATLADGEALRQDDVALLALRVAPENAPTFVASIAPAAEQLGALRGDLRAWLADAGATPSETGDVLIAVGEACANAIEHAGAAPGSAIDVRARLVGREVVLRVSDRGSWRPPRPQLERGHGLRLMRVLMDDIDIVSGVLGTHVELRRQIASRAALVAAAGNGGEQRSPGRGAATLAFARERGVPVARLQGEVDLASVADLGRALAGEVRDADRGLVLDLDGVDYLDSAGLHLLHDAARSLGARGQTLRVAVAPDAEVVRLLELVDVEQSVPVDPSVQAAVDALVPPPPL